MSIEDFVYQESELKEKKQFLKKKKILSSYKASATIPGKRFSQPVERLRLCCCCRLSSENLIVIRLYI